MPASRKKFIKQLGAGMLLAGLPAAFTQAGTLQIDSADFSGDALPDDEKYWKRIARKYYNVSGDYLNLENGYFGVQPKPVLLAYKKNVERVNTDLAKLARKDYPAISNQVKKELAAFLEVSAEEIIITRNATEALNIAIQGYPFKPGDEVIVSQLDYFSMIETFQMLEKRGLLKIKTIDLPLLPQTEEEIVEIYRNAISAQTKVILLTHVSNINGLIVPVSKIAAIAKEKGIDIICDSAHALGHIPLSLPAMGAHFVGFNLHKWIGNPIGAGVLYIKKERITAMHSFWGDYRAAENDINKLAHFGTTAFAVTMTIPDSLAFHRMLGIEQITKRLHYLKTIWVDACKDNPDVEIVTPVQSNLSCAIASFRIKNKKTADVANFLYDQHRILTVGRTLGKEGCIRVTPGLYNSPDDMMRLVEAVNNKR